MINSLVKLRIGHLLPDTIHLMKDNGFTGLFIQFTDKGDIMVTIDTDLINEGVLTSDAITRDRDISSDLRTCLYYALDHKCDQLYFNKDTPICPLLPYYHTNNNEPWDNYVTGVQYNGIYIPGNRWPGELLPDD